MIYLPNEIWRIIISNLAFPDYLNLILVDKQTNLVTLEMNYIHQDYHKYVYFNIDLIKPKIETILIILKRINSLDCYRIIRTLKYLINQNDFKEINLKSLALVLKISRALINSLANLTEIVLGSTITYWMINLYYPLIDLTGELKEKIKNEKYIDLLNQQIFKLN
jgi:hypothetical protein